MISDDIKSRIYGSAIAGACGDALGAPFDFLRQSAILERTGSEGITKFHLYDPAAPELAEFGPGALKGFGISTDDTAMTVAVAVGIMKGRTQDEVIYFIHQALLRWGQHQPWKQADYTPFMDKIDWPDWFDAFCVGTGAGPSTMSALDQGKIGTLEKPLFVSKWKKPDTKEPNNGCGGMIRTAPVGWFAAMGLITHPYRFGTRVAAITHGGHDAMRFSGAISALIKDLVIGKSWDDAASLMVADLSRMASIPAAKLAYNILAVGKKYGPDMNFDVVERLPVEMEVAQPGKYFGYFLSGSVFVQALAICAAAQTWKSDHIGRALTLAATQSGDSDSTAAIVGNILGAQFGYDAIPKHLSDNLYHGQALMDMTQSVIASEEKRAVTPALRNLKL